MDTLKPMTRRDYAETYIAGHGIEIGALHNPLAVSSRAKVSYVDRMRKDDLFRHYPELVGHNLVEVDVVDDGETLRRFSAASLDFVIANHFIEHCEDPIGTLKTFARVLKPGGIAFVAVPDMRKTFDRNRHPTLLAHVVADHADSGRASRIGHFEEWVRDVEPTWGRNYADIGSFSARVRELADMAYSIHFHCWAEEGWREFVDHACPAAGLAVEMMSAQDDEFVTILRKMAVG